jgi:PAS domain S-box-containing protein
MKSHPRDVNGVDPLSLHGLVDDPHSLAEAVVDTVRECLLILDGNLCVRVANRNFFLSFEVAPEETIGRLVFDLGDGQWDIPDLRRLLVEILPHNNTFRDFEVTHSFPHLGRKTMVLNAQKLRPRDGEADLILLAIEDVTSERATHEEDAYSAAVFRSSGEALVALSSDGLIQRWNPAAERLFGYSRAEMIGSSLSRVVPESVRADLDTGIARVQAGESVNTETVRVAKDGRQIDVLVNATPVLNSVGTIIGTSAAITDITARRRLENDLRHRESKLSGLVKERELAVVETHHRIKNNLQTVVSLLSLHATHTNDPHVIEALLEAGGRVQAIARLHETLYTSPNLTGIDFGEYFRQLVKDLSTVHGRPEISIQMDAEDIVLDMDSAVPLGLIANELIINSFKHAFPFGRAGRIKATIEYARDTIVPGRALDEAMIRLRVEDDGVGLPPGIGRE